MLTAASENQVLVLVPEISLTPQMTQQIAYSVLTEEQRKRFETTKELDLSFGVKGRF